MEPFPGFGEAGIHRTVSGDPKADGFGGPVGFSVLAGAWAADLLTTAKYSDGLCCSGAVLSAEDAGGAHQTVHAGEDTSATVTDPR